MIYYKSGPTFYHGNLFSLHFTSKGSFENIFSSNFFFSYNKLLVLQFASISLFWPVITKRDKAVLPRFVTLALFVIMAQIVILYYIRKFLRNTCLELSNISKVVVSGVYCLRHYFLMGGEGLSLHLSEQSVDPYEGR